MLDGDTGEVVERTLTHDGETVRAFYASIPGPAVVGIEATGSMGWVLRLLEELASPCRVGHPAAVRKAETRRQKHDRRDADLLLKLLVEDRFPAIWMPSTEQRDLRALLLHRHQWVRMRTRVPQALEAMALSHGLRRGPSLWSRAGQAALAALPLPPHAAHRRSELVGLYQHLAAQVDQLDTRVAEAVLPRSAATRPSRRWAGHGVGHRGVSRGSRSLRGRQSAGELCGDDPQRILERVPAAARGAEQTRQPAAAVSMGRSGDACRAA
jgi:transposase